MRKRSMVAIALVGVLMLLLAACGGGNPQDDAAEEEPGTTDGAAGDDGEPAGEPEVTLRMGNVLSVETPVYAAAEVFAEAVREKSGGTMDVELFPDGQLGNEQQMLEGLESGAIDLGIVVATTYGNLIPEPNVFGFAWIFRDIDHMIKTMDGEPGQRIIQKLEDETDLRVLSSWYFGTRHMTANKAIETPDDLAGLRIRVVPVPVFLESWSALGATPTAISFEELYTSLQTGVVDAQENPVSVTDSAAFSEVQSHLILSAHTITNWWVSISEQTWESLTEEQRTIVQEALDEAREFNDVNAVEAEQELTEAMRDDFTVLEPDPQPFRDKVAHLPAEFEGGILEDLFNEIQSIE